MNEEGVGTSKILAQLTDCLQEGQGLDIADGSTDLDNAHVHVGGHLLDGSLDLVGDMGNHLNRLAQVVPPPFLLNHRFIDPAGGQVVVLSQPAVGEALIMPQVQVRFGAVIGDEYLPVLVGAHGSGIHVEVGIELLQTDPIAPTLQQAANRGRRQPFPQR